MLSFCAETERATLVKTKSKKSLIERNITKSLGNCRSEITNFSPHAVASSDNKSQKSFVRLFVPRALRAYGFVFRLAQPLGRERQSEHAHRAKWGREDEENVRAKGAFRMRGS